MLRKYWLEVFFIVSIVFFLGEGTLCLSLVQRMKRDIDDLERAARRVEAKERELNSDCTYL